MNNPTKVSDAIRSLAPEPVSIRFYSGPTDHINPRDVRVRKVGDLVVLHDPDGAVLADRPVRDEELG